MEEGEENVIPRSKLEVLTARQVNRILLVNLIAILCATLYRIMVLVLLNTLFFAPQKIETPNGLTLKVRGINSLHPAGHPVQIIDQMLRLLMCSVLVLCAMLFTQRIILCRKKHAVISERVWVALLLWCGILYMNPVFSVSVIRRSVLILAGRPQDVVYKSPAASKFISILYSIHHQGFIATTLFYVWAMLQSFSVLTAVNRTTTARFYAPKIGLILLYMTYREVIARVKTLKIYSAYFPLLSITNMTFDWALSHYLPLEIGLSVLGLTVVEVIIVIAMTFTFFQTRRVLQSADYVKHRTKIVGFRFFVVQNFLFITWNILDRLLKIFFYPPWTRLLRQLTPQLVHEPRSYYYAMNSFQAGEFLVVLIYCITTAYIYLPPDSVGLRGWFRGHEEQEAGKSSTLTSVSYSMTEPAIPDANCFVMASNAFLFNLSWLVYNWNTKKHDLANCIMKRAGSETMLTEDCIEHVTDESSDTHVIVCSLSDRVLISFRGTASKENMKTDVRVRYTKLNTVIPSFGDGHIFAEATSLSSFNMSRAKIHSGFADAYLTVSVRVMEVISRLLQEKKRPVYLTGHSLGGALATLCSLDISLSLPHLILSYDIHVYTFGSPKCGNWAWRIVYDGHVTNHWRVSVAPDLVSMLPKFGGYRHVGKSVTFTTSGRLLLDPDSLEYSLWSREGASVSFHKKSSYLLCFHSFTHLYHGPDHGIPLWPFPVSITEVEKWEQACSVKFPVNAGYEKDRGEEMEESQGDNVSLDIDIEPATVFRDSSAKTVTIGSKRCRELV